MNTSVTLNAGDRVAHRGGSFSGTVLLIDVTGCALVATDAGGKWWCRTEILVPMSSHALPFA